MSKISIYLDGITEDEAIEALFKAHRHPHGDGESCKYHNPLMNQILQDLDETYLDGLTKMMTEILEVIRQDASIPRSPH